MNAPLKLAGACGIALMLGIVTLPAADDAASTTAPANPTFTKDVLPIFQKSCEVCHRPGHMAPFSTVTYEDTRPWARSIKQKVESRYMPPWHIDRTIGEYDPDPSLSDEQIAIISKWVDNGAPKGDPKDAPPAVKWPSDDQWSFGEEPDLIINAPVAHIPATGPDMYPTPAVPSGMTEDRYIKWIQVLPGALKIDHHIIVLAHQPESPIAPLIEERNRGDRNNNNVNNGGGAAGNAAGLGIGRVAVGGEKVARLAEYARGNDGDIYTDNEGMLLQAGAIISFEFHYHPNGESEAVDATKVGIKFWPRGYKPKHLVSTRGISSSDQLIIPPNEVARSDSYFYLQQPARLVSYQPHGHYRLSHMKLEAILPSGEVQVVTDVPHFTWTWQITYPYKYQPAYPKGTVLHSIAWHDNTAANKENPDPTAFVGGGARTVDEMNIGWLDFYYISDDEYAQVSKEQQEREKAKAASTNQQ
jgi:hypothetical protein